MNEEAQKRILNYFIEEARDHLATIEQGLLSLRDTVGDPEQINELFRAAHSIKGEQPCWALPAFSEQPTA